jgi:hypothetical protein
MMEPADHTGPDGRWAFIRDLVVFQLKLLLDALRDVVLSPASIVAGLLDLVSGDDPPGRNFNRLLAAGRRSDAWINLFGEGRFDAEGEERSGDTHSVDSLVGHVERLLLEQVERGGVTASAKEAIDRSLDRVTRTKAARRPRRRR